ncbi:heavy-metal-associated domain-containing protein [Brevibacterium moorei]|uniref:heavy-metal-associated domain-containing protein n=1 Tax=Brevibacterium moorei TaxID=2968457 RepID=UPI00211C1CA0|nr:cation transporter [Brevibacterium sp. 68QC2CO]MCQ9386225.1 cation transporter [Brevibacterium sp. 68QC2CO]
MTTTNLNVSGMTCGHCENAVKEELGNIAGVTSVTVDLHAGQVSPVTVESAAPLDQKDIAAAIDEAGYELV